MYLSLSVNLTFYARTNCIFKCIFDSKSLIYYLFTQINMLIRFFEMIYIDYINIVNMYEERKIYITNQTNPDIHNVIRLLC